jgi:hypothetical protein
LGRTERSSSSLAAGANKRNCLVACNFANLMIAPLRHKFGPRENLTPVPSRAASVSGEVVHTHPVSGSHHGDRRRSHSGKAPTSCFAHVFFSRLLMARWIVPSWSRRKNRSKLFTSPIAIASASCTTRTRLCMVTTTSNWKYVRSLNLHLFSIAFGSANILR